jgi:hypothetical protein
MPIVLKSERLTLQEPSGPVKACNGIALLLLLPIKVVIELNLSSYRKPIV